jgi:hypothetical protein
VSRGGAQLIKYCAWQFLAAVAVASDDQLASHRRVAIRQGHETDRQLHCILQVSNKDELSLISLRRVPPVLTIARRKSITNVT